MNAKNPNTPPKKVTLFRHVFIPVSETRFVPKQCLFLRLIPQYSPARSILKFLALPLRMFLVLTILLLWMSGSIFCVGSAASFNLTLPHQHPDPDSVADELQRTVNASVWRRQMLSESKDQTSSCLTGNPIDDCWRCDPNWAANRQRLADCGIGFGRDAMGGKGGKIYIVTDSSDSDPTNPTPGTLRHAVIQFEPLWIIFSADMNIKLKYELIINNFKTIDGRGANVHITGGGCITIHSVSNIIIHNIHVHHCKPSGNANIRSTPTHVGHWGLSDGDGISIFDSRKIWIDHCSLSYCKDGLIDATMGSTGITISNSYFSHHDKVMLLGHDDKYTQDSGMQVTIAFNHFGEALSQRMPRCRYGYIHVVNNDFTAWEMYAIGGSARPTINSQGNRYTAPVDPNAKEVTKRLDTAETEWAAWNWRSEGDILVNGAFFVPSGAGLSTQYGKASSVEPKSVALINQLTMNAGVFGAPRYNVGQGIVYPGFNGSNHGDGDGDGGNTAISNSPIYGNGGGSNDEYYGMVFKGNGYRASSLSSSSTNLCIQIIIVLYIVTNYSGLLTL